MKPLYILAIALILSGAVRGQTKIDSINTGNFGKVDSTTLLKWKNYPWSSYNGTLDTAHFISFGHIPKMYAINWTKVKTFADFKLIMLSLNITISEDLPNFKKIKKYLIPIK